MKKHIDIKKVYLFTILSFIFTFLFLYIFGKTAPQFYTGFDEHTSPNILSKAANLIFWILLSINFIGTILCIICTVKIIVNKVNKIS